MGRGTVTIRSPRSYEEREERKEGKCEEKLLAARIALFQQSLRRRPQLRPGTSEASAMWALRDVHFCQVLRQRLHCREEPRGADTQCSPACLAFRM